MSLKVTQILKLETNSKLDIPLYISKVKAGFPSPADDYKEKSLDLNEFLIPNPDSTYLVWVEGESMVNANIFSGDLLVVDKSIEFKNNDIVIASLDNDFTVKRLKKEKGKIYLQAENDNFPPIEISGESELIVWGVVTSVIHLFRKRK